jgi:hypothetical protein
LYEVQHQLFQIGADVESFARAPIETKLCMDDLTKPMDVFLDGFKPVVMLTILATRMADGTDEKEVLRFLRNEKRLFYDSLERAKRGTNFVMGQCAHEPLAINRAQRLLDLYGRAGVLVKGIIKKIGD